MTLKGAMDFVCFSQNNWEKRKARKQQLMLHLSMRPDAGGVVYVEPPLNFWRLVLLPGLEWKDPEDRKRWQRALSFKEERIGEKLFLFTPLFFIPFAFRNFFIYRCNLFLSYLLVASRLKALKFKEVVLWLYHPFDYPLLTWFKEKKISVFDWAEEWAEYFMEYPAEKREEIRLLEKKIIADADLVFVVSKQLLEIARDVNPNSHQLLDGTVPEMFQERSAEAPADMKGIRHPVIGYAGTVSARLDVSLLEGLSERFPDCSFVFVGDIHVSRVNISGLKQRPNVYFLGGKAYDELPEYITQFDICLLPYLPEIKTAPPTKVFDYLATGKPIVSIDLPELAFLGDLLRMAMGIDEFERQIRDSLSERSPEPALKRKLAARQNSWALRSQEIMSFVKGERVP